MRHGEPMAHNDVQFCTTIIYNEKESVFLIVERKGEVYTDEDLHGSRGFTL